MLSSLRAITAALVWGIAVAASGAQGRDANDTRPGRAEYIEMGCYQCHGYEGQGARRTGPKLAPKPMDWEVFSAVVRQPPGVMPAYSPKVLGEEKLKRIYAYLVSIPPAPDPSTLKALAGN